MNEAVFLERYKNLNPGQKEAVDTIEGPVMVVAGPGTGKTTVLTLRIANILRTTDTPAHGILALTYTDAGVKAMREKLREIIGNRAHDVYIHTFHSFASAMIGEYPDHFLEIRDSRQMTDVEAEGLIRTILLDVRFAPLRPLGKPDAYISAIVRAISESKKEALTPDEIREKTQVEIERLKTDEGSLSTRGASKGKIKAEVLETIEKLEKTLLFADVFETYEAEKHERKLRDYDDLIIALLVALRTDELFLRLIQERFLYLLVDEHQDTNDSQNYILNLIAEFFETPNVFIVGDEKQAIYRFQGASVKNFLLLRSRWKDMKTIALEVNYRSHQALLDATFAMIEQNYAPGEHTDLRVALRASGTLSRNVEVIASENVAAMEEYLVAEIDSLVQNESNASIAVIVRRNRELERVIELLESHHIPVSSERSVDIFHHPIGAAFFDLIHYLLDPADIAALSRTISSGLWNLSFADSVAVIRGLRANERTVLQKLPALEVIRQRLLASGAVGALVDIAEASGLLSLIARDPVFIRVWRGIVALAETLVRESSIDNPRELFSAMLSYRDSAESKPVKVAVGAPDVPVKAMTAHGSKGLEFDYVFVPYASDDAWVGKTFGSSFALSSGASKSEAEDIRRLFYVALTRARKHAVILYGMEESDGKTLVPLRFIDELDKKSLTRKSVPRSEALPVPIHAQVSQAVDFLVDEAKRVLTTSGLSPTALNHFLECPSKFLYESILKLPQAPSPAGEKGSAMHEALSRVWLTEKKKPEEIQHTIETVTKEYIETSFLSQSDKEAVIRDITENAPKVAEALLSHFAAPGKIFSEVWVERPEDILYQHQKVTIPLHGKLDAVVDNGTGVEIFDYKTRQAMSVAAIKGETKNSDGSYFRQLAFYQLLVENDYRFRGKAITNSLVFVSPDEHGRCPTITVPVTSLDIKDLQEKIKTLVESVWSGRIGTEYCTDRVCRYCGFKRLL